MSRGQPRFYDVFLSHSPSDRALAQAVRDELTAAGLAVYPLDAPTPGEGWDTAIRHGVEKSLTFVVLMTPSFAEQPNLFIEVGVAWGWETPIYLLLGDIDRTAVPAFLQRYPAYKLWDQLPDLVNSIPRRAERLTDGERTALVECYEKVGIPVDRLLMTPAASGRLAKFFRERTRRAVLPADLVRELLRMRKARRLPKLVHRPAT